MKRKSLWIGLFIIALLLLAGSFLFSYKEPPLPDPPKTKIVIIFSDVTSSLIPNESEKVADLTADVIDSLPDGAIYTIYPIQIETQRLAPIKEGKVSLEKNQEANFLINKQRREELKVEIGKLYKLVKTIKNNISYGRPDNHTCILNTLNSANNYFQQFKDEKLYELELIYISDMIEECDRTPLRQPIVLAKNNISNEIRLAQNSKFEIDLSQPRITIIVPSTSETYTVSHRPNLDDLRFFWKAIFSRCGLTEDSLNSGSQYYFSVGLPQRFKKESK